MLATIANREDPDQTVVIWVCAVCLGLGRQLVFESFRIFMESFKNLAFDLMTGQGLIS